jgi:sugar lactone lactonase YvrE
MTPASRYDEARLPRPTSSRWTIARLTEPNRLWGANGVAFGPDGRLYVAQFLGGQISAVDIASGDVEVVVPFDGPVRTPDDIAFGADGAIYIADLAPGRVWRRTAEGEFDLLSDSVRAPNGITCVGDRLFVNEMVVGGRLFEVFTDGAEPRLVVGGIRMGNAMQAGPDGRLYYPHMFSDQVWRVSPDGGRPELVAEHVDAPVAVRFDRAGTLLVLSRGPEGLVTRIDLNTGSRSITTTGIAGLDNAAFDDDNRMFVSSFARGGIHEIHDGARVHAVVPHALNGPFGISADRRGKVYVADHFGVATVSGAGDVELVDLASGSLPGLVHGVAADGELLQLTTAQGAVHAYDPANRTTRVRAAGLGALAGVAVGPDGQVVVAEPGAGRVLSIDKSDTVTVLAEGLDHPVGVAVDGDGTCFVSDDRRGCVARLDGGEPVMVAEDLGAPQASRSRMATFSRSRSSAGGCSESRPPPGRPWSKRKTSRWAYSRRPAPSDTPRRLEWPTARHPSPTSPSRPTAPCSFPPTAKAVSCG